MRVFLPLHMDISQTARMALSGAHTSTKPNPLSYLLLLPAQHYRFIKICALFPEKLTKMWEKMPYLATLLKVRGISWDVAGSASKFIAGLFWAETHHPSRFQVVFVLSCWPTDQQIFDKVMFVIVFQIWCGIYNFCQTPICISSLKLFTLGVTQQLHTGLQLLQSNSGFSNLSDMKCHSKKVHQSMSVPYQP